MDIDWVAIIGLFISYVFTPLVSAASLVTASIVIAAELRRRKRIRSVVWDVTRIGFKQLPSGTKHPRVSLTNNGSETALVSVFVTCNAELEENPDEPLRWQFPPHQPQDITFKTEDLENSWLFIAWISADNRKVSKQSWVPLMPGSPLETELITQMSLRSRFRVMSRRLRGVTTPIGPGGQYGVRVGRREPTDKQRLEMLRLVTESKAQLYQK